MQKAPYKVDLRAYHRECEANYLRLLKLLPADCDTVSFQVSLPDHQRGDVTLTVVERCKYTSMARLTQQGTSGWGNNKQFDLRIYHDAHMVEVTAFQRQRRIDVKYAYPNVRMHQPDEKLQQQRFLSECLVYCLEHGLVPVDIAIP